MYARVRKDNKVNAQSVYIYITYYKRKHCVVSHNTNQSLMILQIDISEFRVQKFRSSLRPKDRALIFVRSIVRLQDEKSYARAGRPKNENNEKKKKKEELCSISGSKSALS